MNNSRSWNSSRNAFVGVVCQLIIIVLSFAVRTIFAKLLSEEYLGVSGLYTNILTILNLTELGLNTAIVFALYKPIAVSDKKKIIALMQFYRKAYFLIGCFFLGAGLILIPFLPYLINGSTVLVNTTLVYLLYLAQTVTSYWFFAYRSVLLTASQNEYIVSVVNCVTNFIVSCCQIFVLVLFRDRPEHAFYAYVIVGVVGNIMLNAVLAIIVGKKFPYIKKNERILLSADEKKGIFKNVAGLSLYKVSSTVNTSVDNIIIAGLIDLASVGRYSNYLLINAAVSRIVSVAFNPLTASIGNLNVTETIEKKETVFWSLDLIYFWVYGLCGICMYVLFDPFIGGIWLGGDWVLPDGMSFALALKFWVDGLLGAVIKYREAAGLFWQTKVRYVMATVINIIVSIVLVRYTNLGILGVVIGSIVAEMLAVIIDPWIVFRNVFLKKPTRFYLSYGLHFVLLLLSAFIVKYISLQVNAYSVFGFLVSAVASIIIPSVIWFIVFNKTKEFTYIKTVVSSVKNRLIFKRG